MRIIPECCVGCIKLNNCEDSQNGELIACSGYVIDPDYVDEKVQRYILQHEDSNQKAKADDGKPKLSIVPIKIIFAIEKIRKYGNDKYPEGGSDNWKTVEPERHYEASLRHTAKHWNDPFAIDPESGLPHYFHKVCDDAFFIEQNWDKFMEAIEKYKEEK